MSDTPPGDDKVVPITIPPKSSAHSYRGQRYLLLFRPNAPVANRWGWEVRYTQVFTHSGSAPTLAAAERAARRMIDTLRKTDPEY